MDFFEEKQKPLTEDMRRKLEEEEKLYQLEENRRKNDTEESIRKDKSNEINNKILNNDKNEIENQISQKKQRLDFYQKNMYNITIDLLKSHPYINLTNEEKKQLEKFNPSNFINRINDNSYIVFYNRLFKDWDGNFFNGTMIRTKNKDWKNISDKIENLSKLKKEYNQKNKLVEELKDIYKKNKNNDIKLVLDKVEKELSNNDYSIEYIDENLNKFKKNKKEKVIKDKVIKDKVIKDKVIKEKVIKDKVIKEKVIKDKNDKIKEDNINYIIKELQNINYNNLTKLKQKIYDSIKNNNDKYIEEFNKRDFKITNIKKDIDRLNKSLLIDNKNNISKNKDIIIPKNEDIIKDKKNTKDKNIKIKEDYINYINNTIQKLNYNSLNKSKKKIYDTLKINIDEYINEFKKGDYKITNIKKDINRIEKSLIDKKNNISINENIIEKKIINPPSNIKMLRDNIPKLMIAKKIKKKEKRNPPSDIETLIKNIPKLTISTKIKKKEKRNPPSDIDMLIKNIPKLTIAKKVKNKDKELYGYTTKYEKIKYKNKDLPNMNEFNIKYYIPKK